MSIFTKDCPQCAETNAAYAVRCKCGFAFNADDGAESQTEEEITLEEEKLYQEYLAARAQQASSTADQTTKLAASQPANQAKLKEAEQAKAAAERAQTELKVQAARVVESPTERKHAKVEPPAPPAITQTPNVKSAPATPKAPVAATVSADTTQTQVSKPSGEAKQSWLISGAESNAQSNATTQPSAVKPAATTTAKPGANNTRPTPTATNVAAAKMSAAERAKKLEQRLKTVQAKRDSNATTMGASATSKINTSGQAAKPDADSARVSAAAPAAATPTPVKGPATPQTTTAAETDDTSAPPSKPTSSALDIKPDQPQALDKTPPKPKKVNGSDTAPLASGTIEVPAAKETVRSPNMPVTAKADLEAALQALDTRAPETNPTIPTPTKSGNGADQADAVPEELLDANAQAPLGDLTQSNSLGCTEKECPNCTALVPMDVDNCGCGFAFPPEDDAMPSLSLSDSDVEALEKRKKSSGISHLGK